MQPEPAQPSDSASTAITGSQAIQAANSIAASTSIQEAGITQSKSVKVWVASTLLFCTGLFLFSARTTKNEALDPRKSIRARSMPLV